MVNPLVIVQFWFAYLRCPESELEWEREDFWCELNEGWFNANYLYLRQKYGAWKATYLMSEFLK